MEHLRETAARLSTDHELAAKCDHDTWAEPMPRRIGSAAGRISWAGWSF